MKCQPRILAGTALGLLMASTPLSAAPLHGDIVTSPILRTGIILAQANCAEGESAEACAEGGEKPNRKRQQEKRAAPAAQDEPSAQAEPEQKPRREKRKEMQAEPAQREESAPADTGGEMAPAMKPEEKPRREKRKQKQQQAEPTQQNEQAAPAGEESETKPAVKRQEKQSERKQRRSNEETKPAETEQPPAQSEEPAEQATQPKSKKKELKEFLNKKQDGEEATEPQQAEKPKARKSRSADEAKPAGEPAGEAAPKPETKPAATPAENERAPAADEKPADQATQPKSRKEELREFLNKKKGGEEATEPQQASPEEQKPSSGENAGEQAPATGEAEGGKRGATQPVLPSDTQEEQAMPKSDTEATPLPEDAAPLPDSAKKAGRRGEGKGEGRQARQPAEQPGEQPAGEAEAAPRSDSAAQSAIERIGKIESVEAMQGKRIDAEQWRKDRRERREERRKRDNIDVVKKFGDRVIVKYGDNIYVDNRDVNERLERHARDSYIEELPRNLTRTTIVKENGARVVTIRNAYGDIVRRSRIMPDDREVVLYYVPEDDYDRIQRGYIDAGADLPPLRLSIPADEYILDAERARPEDYYTYLDAPPVEPVERIYSVNEVVHSARIRDKVRRVDLDTITFDTGSADIGENQISKLEALGEAMDKILEQNPAETFLIEGHTDAVGSDESNLVLSDKRADSVAEALTKVFDIPAENLTTQGYGEEYLKVNTDGANRENRRVAVRRITPLVSPVASAK
jgi:outer membrane protein OmpA-like peptidoglycan-associated protein